MINPAAAVRNEGIEFDSPRQGGTANAILINTKIQRLQRRAVMADLLALKVVTFLRCTWEPGSESVASSVILR